MDAASTAVNKILGNAGQKDTEFTKEVAPAVEHETVVNKHETKEQTVVDRERHQDHFHTTVQPLTDREVEGTQHEHEQAATQYKNINKDKEANNVKDRVANEREFNDETVEGATVESKTNEGEVVGEQVHHHLHEVVQPVIEKETVKPSVTHKTIPVKEHIQEETKNHGVTRKEPISVDEFKARLDGEKKGTTKVEGEPEI